MSTVNVNRLQYGGIGGLGTAQVHVPCAEATAPVKQGDLVYMDATLHIAKPLDSDAHAALLLGVAAQPSAVSSSLDNSSAPAPKALIVQWSGVWSLKTTAAETYTPGLAVYAGADAQTITTVSGTNQVGTIVLPVGVASVTGAAGVDVGVWIKSKIY